MQKIRGLNLVMDDEGRKVIVSNKVCGQDIYGTSEIILYFFTSLEVKCYKKELITLVRALLKPIKRRGQIRTILFCKLS